MVKEFTTFELHLQLIKQITGYHDYNPKSDDSAVNVISSEKKLLNLANIHLENPLCDECQAKLAVDVVPRF